MTIKQGDIFWVKLRAPLGSEPGFCHPHVVVQNDVFNASRINTVVVCALTANLKRTQAPGNATLSNGEANLTKKSVVNISQVVTVNKSDFEDKIGSLSSEKTKEIIEGIKLLVDPLPDPRT
ncbi:MAG: type II toxin-antitoxin system PemK/MazF family toxin [Candidatus Aminicenantes bacterium]|nr:type II toxin-antitoxin system PemK/MazF family toxin [Candidatus Aminicenantes bacterium]